MALSQSLLSPAWDADGARRLERCLAAGGYAADEIASQRELWVADPQSWAPPVRDETLYREFLERLGVRDGLIPSALGPIVERQGSSLHPPAIAKQLGLPDLVATGWAVDVAQHWTGGNHPYTRYSFARPLTVLPGSVQAAGLQPTARREFAELVLHGLGEWDDNALAVTVWRPNRPTVQQDRHSWPTPLASALRHLPWLPVTGDDGDLEFRPPAQVWYSFEGDLPPFVPAMPRSVRELLGDARALARAEAAGLRRWGAPANAADAVRELGLALQDGAVPDYLSATFKKEYSRALASAAKEGAWPWPPGTEVVLAADRAGRLEALRPAPDELLYLPDGHDSLKQSLVELAGHPVLPADPEEGERTVSLLRAHGLRVLPLSEIDVKVFSSNQQVVPGPGRPLLVDGREWLVTVVAVVLELKGGPFRRRRTERTLRRLLAQLGAVRLARLPNVSIRVGGIDAPPPANVRSVPLPHAAHPTIAVWDAAGEWEELQSCASALSHLLSQPYLHDPLELALIKIEKMLGGASAHDLDDELLASALDTTAARVGEVRRGIEGDLDGLKRKLRPVLMCLADPADVHIAGDAVDRCASEQELEAVLADRHHDLALPAADIVALARRPSPLDEIRDALGLDFAAFNNALSALGPPYAPLTHPDLHDAAFATFAAQNHEAILDRLRERYRPVAERGLAIDRYVQGRNMEGLVPDPAWLPARRVPSEAQMRARVAAWLRGHGASDDLGAPGALAPVGEIRAKANARLDSLVARAAPLVRAWCRTRPSPIPPGWDGTPLLEATFALEANGIADLVEPVDNQLLEAIAAGAGWPDGMDLTVDATDLGLTDADLAVTAGSGSSRERPVPPPATIRIGSSVLPVGTDNLARIAEVALLSVDPIFLSETGKTSLAVLASPPGPDGHGRPTGRTVVTRNRGMNEDQRSAVGIVGEVAARAWLSRKYREVRWRSGYAAIVSADPHASDSFGYDFEVDWRNTTLMFEVKAFTAEAGSLAEFEMGESEVRAAQAAARNDRYRILLVTQALDPVERRIHELPNPFSAKGQGRFRVVGRGLRYQCAPR